MKKKVLVVLLVLLLALSTVFAAETTGATKKGSFGIGLEAGTNSGLALRYGFGKFDIQGDIGFGAISKGLSLDASAAYKFSEVEFKDGTMPFTTGPMVGLNIHFSDPFALSLDILWMVSVGYDFESIPLSLFFRFAPGVGLTFADEVKFGFSASAALGALWTF